MFFHFFFEDILIRSAESKSASSKQFAVEFSRFVEVEIMIFRSFLEVRIEILRYCGAPGTDFEDFSGF